MNKSELIDAIAKQANLTKKDSQTALDAFTDSITKALKKGEKVAITGFGSWEVKERAARTGRNPQTKKAIKIPACKVPKFRPGKNLKDVVNKKK
ncbi:MAG: HU family DNA-binding protein [Candidatus Wallbacteria bacterium]|nr:HU family DNA-binding protein [Candidatus Wallbacteria bacterium]